jgi:lysophospholipase L1-like esterase
MKRLLIAAVTSVLLAAPLPALAGPSGERGNPNPQNVEWYLALGDSLAAGYQPGVGDDRDGGYVGDVLTDLQADWTKTKLVNLACSGETSTQMIEGGDCVYDEGSQLAEAVQFLEAHKDKVSLVTVTIGANDVTPCVGAEISIACIGQSLSTLGGNLSVILNALRTANPDVPIVVTNYYNPYLALWVLVEEPLGPSLAQQSSGLQVALNQVIAGTASTVPDVSTADVATAFQSYNDTLVETAYGTIPTNVASICMLTWMCTLGDIHANDDGYDRIAGAVLAVVE